MDGQAAMAVQAAAQAGGEQLKFNWRNKWFSRWHSRWSSKRPQELNLQCLVHRWPEPSNIGTISRVQRWPEPSNFNKAQIRSMDVDAKPLCSFGSMVAGMEPAQNGVQVAQFWCHGC